MSATIIVISGTWTSFIMLDFVIDLADFNDKFVVIKQQKVAGVWQYLLVSLRNKQ